MIYGIIQARCGSTRLLNKIFMEFCNKPNLYHVYKRVSKSKKIDKIIIATTDKSSDDRVYKFCVENNIECFRGNQDDVLDRYYQCVYNNGAKDEDIIVRITADCPLIDFNLMDEMIIEFTKGEFDYVSNTIEPTYPDGLDIEVFSFKALKLAWENAKLLSEREHVTPYIKKSTNLFKVKNYTNNLDLSDYRWTLDEKEDYELINRIYEELYPQNHYFITKDILKFLGENPLLKYINKKYERDEGYKKSLRTDKLF